MSKVKKYYKTWKWERYSRKQGDVKFHILPVFSVGKESDIIKVRFGWMFWIFVGERLEGFSINYLGLDNE